MMASRDHVPKQPKTNKSNNVSTRRINKTRRAGHGSHHQSSPVVIPTILARSSTTLTPIGSTTQARKITTQNFANNRSSSLPQQPQPQQSESKNLSPSQNYSSRNSLRTAVKQEIVFPYKMPNIDDFNGFSQFMEQKTTEDYMPIDSASFIKVKEGEDLICLLCAFRKRLSEQTRAAGESARNFHLSHEEHNRRFNELEQKLLIEDLPDNSLQINSVRELLNKWYNSNVLTSDSIALRLSIIQEFNFILTAVMPESYYRIYGSFSTGTSLNSSDINLELVHPNSDLFKPVSRSKISIHHKLIDPNADLGNQINNHTLHYDLVSNAIDTLYKLRNAINNNYTDCPTNSFTVISDTEDLLASMPKLVLRHESTKISLQLCCYAWPCYRLAVLLRIYLSIDYRACILSILVKYWAKECRIDNPERGTLKPDTFVIMVIYYLQRTSSPVLPCIHEIVRRGKSNETHNKSDDNDLVDNMKSLKLGPSAPNDIMLRKDKNDALIKDKQNDDNYNIVVEEEDEDFIDAENELIKNLDWVTTNEAPVHELFLGFLKFMCNEFDDVKYKLSIRTLEKIENDRKVSKSHYKYIENPVDPSKDLSRDIGKNRSYNYIKNCFRQSYYYLTSIPVNEQFKGRIYPGGKSDPRNLGADLFFSRRRMNSYYNMRKAAITLSKPRYDPVAEMIQQNLFARDVRIMEALIQQANNQPNGIDFLPPIIANFYVISNLRPDDISATNFCKLCKEYGHERKFCPKGKIEDLKFECNNYDIDLDLVANFDPYFEQLLERDSISPRLAMHHQCLVGELEHFIKTATGLNCKLKLFGSTVNNLGSYDSDLDICMTLDGNLTGQGVNCKEILARVHQVLLKNPNVDPKSIDAILGDNVRVPIIKFQYSKFDVDLSMYNQCAIYNSELLRTYSLIDHRVAKLFYLVKRYAKGCLIADAPRGSLSSYAWSILVIHYLQQTKPRILPILQETPRNIEKPMIGVNGWNVWFNDDLQSISMMENKMTLTQLFKGFFLYYGCFDFNNYVVSIRKSNLITRYQKSWNDCYMAIEDPFELTYNLASRLDEPMAYFIRNSFAQAFRHVVRTQTTYKKQKQINRDHRMNIDQIGKLFMGKFITPSDPPSRGCRICHNRHHMSKDCPEKHNNRSQSHNNTRLR